MVCTTFLVAVTIQFPSSHDVVYDRAPLLVVLCQVRFPPVYSLLGDTGVAGFQEAIRARYPLADKSSNVEVAMSPGHLSATERAPVWRFADEAQQWIVSIATDFVALETPAYTHFDDFCERFEQVLDVLDRTVHPAPSVRVGLRKVNDVQMVAFGPARPWSALLKTSLLGLVGAGEVPVVPQTSLTEVTYVDEHDDRMVIRHGVLPSSQDAYRIDIDYATERPYRVAADSGLADVVRAFSRSETDFFNWCLLPELVETLGPRPRPNRKTHDPSS